MPAFGEGGRGEQFGRRDHALTAAAMDANLECHSWFPYPEAVRGNRRDWSRRLIYALYGLACRISASTRGSLSQAQLITHGVP
jgi:hypothetical protein